MTETEFKELCRELGISFQKSVWEKLQEWERFQKIYELYKCELMENVQQKQVIVIYDSNTKAIEKDE